MGSGGQPLFFLIQRLILLAVTAMPGIAVSSTGEVDKIWL